MTRTDMTDTDVAEARRRRLAQGVAGAAVLIGAVTVVSRVVGFGRQLVFAHTVGSTCLGTAYLTANQVPNVIFNVVAGGALASVVVPVLSGPVARGDAGEVRRISSALLTWTVVILVPLVVAGAFLTRPIVGLLLGDAGGCARAEVVAVSARMLVVFLPQLVLYGVAVVLTGVLQAHRRFLGPAMAPLLSSLVVAASYLAFFPLGRGRQDDLAHLGLGAELVLSVGTTLGAAALALAVVVPVAARAGLALRPTLSFPPGVAARARALALAGVSTLAAQEATTIVVFRLANDYGSRGAITLYAYAWTLYLLPWAVLAVPIATSAFPMLSARADEGDDRGYAAMVASTTRAVVLVSCAAAAVLAAAAAPIARVFVLGGPGGADPTELARALVAFAPGLVGYGLVAHLGRALYASGHGRASAVSTVAGWAVVIVADVALVLAVPPTWAVAGLGLGNTIGMTVAGVLLAVAVVRERGAGTVAGTGRALAAGVLGGVAGYAAGARLAAVVGAVGLLASVGVAMLAAVLALAAFTAVSFVVDGRDLRAVAVLVTRRLTR